VKPWSTKWKQAQLDLLQEEWSECEKCGLCTTRTNVVFGEGNPDADILFVGEAPGEWEDESGIPFVDIYEEDHKGVSGKVLSNLLIAAGINREDCYITNIVACHPPENRDPSTEEKKICMERVQKIIYIVDPLVIVGIGKIAFNMFATGATWGIEKEHGKLFTNPHPSIKTTGERNGYDMAGVVMPLKGADKKTYTLDYDVMGIYHPSYILRKDPRDRKGDFLPRGLADKTLKDLKWLKSHIDQLKEEHHGVRKLL